MASTFQDNSHYEPDSPRASVHEARGAAGEGSGSSPAKRSDEASSEDHVQEKSAEAAPLGKRGKVRRHCGRFWLWYLIGVIIFLAIFLPILFKVILPAIVQNIINKQEMPVKGGAFVAMSSDKLKINLDTVLDTPLPARIDPTTLFLYNKKTPGFSPFVNVTLPELHLDGTTDVVVKDQVVTVTNETELITWFEDVFDYPSVDLSFRGDPVVNLGKLKSTAHIDKTVQAKSLNKLKGFAIEQLSLVIPPAENGTNIEGTLNLPNWGTLTIGIGDLSLNLMSGDVRIGLITVYDVYIPPGNNSKYFNGQLYFDTLIQNFGTILTNQGDALSSGNVQIDATGNATVVDGQHIGFVEAVLNNRRVTSTAPIVKLLGDIVGSVTGSNVSLTDMIGSVFGNSSLVEDILSHWNVTKGAQDMKRSQPTLRKGINGRTAMNLFKIGMKSIGVGKR